MAVAQTLPAWLLHRVAERPQVTVLRRKHHGIWKSVSWGELGDNACRFGMGLKAAGLRVGEAVAVLSETRLEWVYADLGIIGAGGVTVGLYPSDGPDTVGDMLRATDAGVVFVENDEHLDKVLQIRGACPALRRIVIFDMRGLRDFADPACESLTNFLARGAEHDRTHPADWADGIGALDPAAPAMILHTQGTTGRPKPVSLTHGNVFFQVNNAASLLGQVEGDERLAFLPMALATERIIGLYVGLYCGTIGNYVESADTVAEDLREVRPTVLAAPPRLWEKYYANVVLAAGAATPLQRRLYRWAMTRGERGANARLADMIVLRRIRRLLGLDRIRLAYVDGGGVSAALLRWYLTLGIRLIERYGPAEAGGLAALMPADTPGECVAAEAIECQLRMSPYIEDVMIAGAARAGLCCLVIIDHDSVERWAQDNNVPYTGFAGLARAPDVQTLIQGEIEQINAGLRQRHGIRAFRLLEQKPEPGDPELTPMLRLRREVMHRKHAVLIDSMLLEA